MEKKLILVPVVFAIIFCSFSISQAQLKDGQTKATDYSGPIVKQNDPSDGANLGNFFNVKMNHSYSVNFGTFGGQVQNFNAYTNTMQFFFSEKLTGRVDLSLIHSPFSNNNLNGFNADQEVQFILQNAELNYKLSENSSLQLRVNQYPQGYGYSPGFGSYRNTPFQNSPAFGQ